MSSRSTVLFLFLCGSLSCGSNSALQSEETPAQSESVVPSTQGVVEQIAPEFGIRDGVLVDAWMARDESGEVLQYRTYEAESGVRVTTASKGLSGMDFELSVGALESWIRGSSLAGHPYVAAAPAAPDIPWFVAVEFDGYAATMTIGGIDVEALVGVIDRVVPLDPELAAAELEALSRSWADFTETDSVEAQGARRIRLTEDAELDRRFFCLTSDAELTESCRPLDGLATFGHVVTGDRWLVVGAYPLEGAQPTISVDPDIEAIATDSEKFHYLVFEVPDGTDLVRLCIAVDSVQELCTDFDRLLA